MVPSVGASSQRGGGQGPLAPAPKSAPANLLEFDSANFMDNILKMQVSYQIWAHLPDFDLLELGKNRK